MTQDWICMTEGQTAETARIVADLLPSPCVVCLYGDLGAGKTSFSRALIRHVVQDNTLTVPSPTYTLVQTYNDDSIWHFDLYRLEREDDLYDIGWEEALTKTLCLIEWPERLGNKKPENSVDIKIETLDNGARRITLHE